MNDLISRRKAVLALLKETHKDGSYGYLNAEQAENVIMALPSAQTEDCEGCKHLRKWENEVEYGYMCPCTVCKRWARDYYER